MTMTAEQSGPAAALPGIPPREVWPVEVISGRACPSCGRLYSLVRPAHRVDGDDVTVRSPRAREHSIPAAGSTR
ncbi:hypothetical protein [Streptomyces graminilatus]|uniref:hypothetical protein n=1 Tax=Streptomyces graminilatus TaxID=1464070 RepID=UPI000B2068FB|nr:hypothetical protein [Streptomyces graminilatus]